MEDSFDALCPVGWFGAVAEGDGPAGVGVALLRGAGATDGEFSTGGGFWAGGAGASATLFGEEGGCDVS